jgi:hypothetical protein
LEHGAVLKVELARALALEQLLDLRLLLARAEAAQVYFKPRGAAAVVDNLEGDAQAGPSAEGRAQNLVLRREAFERNAQRGGVGSPLDGDGAPRDVRAAALLPEEPQARLLARKPEAF